MRARTIIPAELMEVAERQSGVLTAAQALAHGIGISITRRLVARGEWQRLGYGLYLAGPQPVTWEAHAAAGVALGGDSAMLSGHAAGYLWQVIEEEPDSIEVLIPDTRKTQSREPVVFRRSRQLPQPFGNPARTPLPETILDLCEREPENITRWIDAALRRKGFSAKSLLVAMARRPRLRRRKLIEAVITDHISGANTELERVYLHRVELAHGLPNGHRQVRRGARRTDVEYEEMLIVELDGRLGHLGWERFRDMNRDNDHLLEGAPTLRYGWFDTTERSCAVARQVGRMLRNLGWTGEMRTCPRCPDEPLP